MESFAFPSSQESGLSPRPLGAQMIPTSELQIQRLLAP
jgi:hypothetical protein